MSKTYKECSNQVFRNIENFYKSYNPIIATKMVIDYYGEDMINDIESNDFRIKIWQVSHSLLYLENDINFRIDCVEELEMIAEESDYSAPQKTCAKHLLSVMDSILNYLDN